MLSGGSLRWAAALCMLILTACEESPTPIAEAGEKAEASYRLLFNGQLVGHALFVLEVDDQGEYRLETLTTPAGEMAERAAHEILEMSRGVLDASGIRPRQFDHSLRHADDIDLVRLTFDWDQRHLRLSRGDRQETLGLVPDSHDRLSYLLLARRLADAGTGTAAMTLVTAEASEQTVLTVTGREQIELPLGRFDAVAVYRRSAKPDDHRVLWFDSSVSPLPLRVLQRKGESAVDMQLEFIERGRHSESE